MHLFACACFAQQLLVKESQPQIGSLLSVIWINPSLSLPSGDMNNE